MYVFFNFSQYLNFKIAYLQELTDRIGEIEDRNTDLQRIRKKGEQEIESLKKNNQDLELSLRKAESEKQAREHNIRSLQDEMANQDESVAKLNKEKKHQEEVCFILILSLFFKYY